MKPGPRRPEHYLTPSGAVVIPPALAATLDEVVGLRSVRTRRRGLDPELDAVLLALTIAATTARVSDSGPTRDRTPTPRRRSTEHLSTADVAQRLDVTDRTVRRFIAEGRLPARLVGSRWVIDVDDFAAFPSN